VVSADVRHGVALHWLSEVDAAEFATAGQANCPRTGTAGRRGAGAGREPELLLLDEPFAALDVDAAPALRA